jgi:outer membrane protein OmpA-like peptidoglycan-associated protein
MIGLLLSKPRVLLAVLSTIAVAISTSGCFEAGATGAQTDACGKEPAGQDGAPIAVLVQEGVNRLGSGGAEESAFETVLAKASEMKARLMVGAVAARGAVPLTADSELVAAGANDLMREQALECRTGKAQDAYRRIAQSRPAGGVNLISALRGLHAELPGNGKPVDVVILGSVLNTSAPNLRETALRTSAARAINGLAKAGLNFSCEGWRVHVVGGAVDHGQPLTPAPESQLREWWRRYFQHCGGSLVYFAPQLTSFPESKEIAAADRSLIPIRFERTNRAVEATLSADVLFDFGSAELRPKASTVLRRLLPEIERATGQIEIVGYTDSIGSPGVNLPLSRARARAVAAWVLDHSKTTTPIIVRGHGATDPVASNADAAGRAKNRRVVIVIPR